MATTLTDYMLSAAALCAALGFPKSPAVFPARGPVLFFTGFALAAAAGGTWHGFFSLENTANGVLVWWLSMVCAGLSAAGLAVSGCELLGYRNRAVLQLSTAGFVVAFGAYLLHDPRFLSCLVATTGGTLICAAGLLRQVGSGRGAAAWLAIAGLTMSVLAALAQQRGLAIDAVHFDRNATYHVLLLPALGVFYAGLRRIALSP